MLFPGKYEVFPSNSNVVAEIFKNEFDVTWHQQYKVDGSEKREWGLIPGENSDDDGTVVYRYNKEYFRSDEFTSDHAGLHVVFAGCSETEGQGGNIDDSWGKILFDTIKKDLNVDGFYNLGKSGYGWQKIITQLKVYIDKYGKPDSLFVLLPNIGRTIEWSTEDNCWYAKQSYPRFDPAGSYASVKNMYVSDISDGGYKKIFIDFIISWRLFEDFCKTANIGLVWGTWEPIDNYNFSKLDLFNNFIPLPKEDIVPIIEKYRKNGKVGEFDLDKRDGHHGRLFHEYWADKMLEEAKRKGFIND